MVKVWGAWHYLGGAGWFMAAVLVVSSPFLLCLPPVGWFVIAWIWSHLKTPD